MDDFHARVATVLAGAEGGWGHAPVGLQNEQTPPKKSKSEGKMRWEPAIPAAPRREGQVPGVWTHLWHFMGGLEKKQGEDFPCWDAPLLSHLFSDVYSLLPHLFWAVEPFGFPLPPSQGDVARLGFPISPISLLEPKTKPPKCTNVFLGGVKSVCAGLKSSAGERRSQVRDQGCGTYAPSLAGPSTKRRDKRAKGSLCLLLLNFHPPFHFHTVFQKEFPS